ncbi:MAG: hypothetical protein ACFFAS_12905 [Promethearchaeota archaeon]
MVGKLQEECECFEALFVRHDVELEPLMGDVLMICSNSIEELINTFKKYVNVDGTIEIYKKFNHLKNPIFHKSVKIYSYLEPAYL